MFLMWIIPLLLVVLVIYLLSGNKPALAPSPTASRVCGTCNQPVQSDWKNCPRCGQTL